MKIVIFGLSITSAWGNGHATTYRALVRALHKRGHDIIFFERNAEWYESNRDLPNPDFCRVKLYQDWSDVLGTVRQDLADADIAMVGSYFPDGLLAVEEVLGSPVNVKAFYDIDTPITMAGLETGGTEYISTRQLPGFDVYFSFTGGPTLTMLEERFGVQRALPLYCSFDSASHSFSGPVPEFACDLSYMGTYAADRQPKLEELFCHPAVALPNKKLILAGAQYPPEMKWPANVHRIIHLYPRSHGAFYRSSRLTLNLTRQEMVAVGYSPSVRLFEAAGYSATIVTDAWEGLDTFFVPNEEILVAEKADDVIRYLSAGDRELRAIGHRAQERVLAEHNSEVRAREFEDAVANVRQFQQYA